MVDTVPHMYKHMQTFQIVASVFLIQTLWKGITNVSWCKIKVSAIAEFLLISLFMNNWIRLENDHEIFKITGTV